MAVSYTKEYKNNKKLEYKIAVRQGMFITDYVKTKYDQIYMEAADLYNRINNKYPCKPNLMKTAEFRTWKNKIAAEKQQPTIHVPRQRDRYLKPTEYPNITSPEDNTNNNNTSPRPTNLVIGNRQFVLEIPLMNPYSTNITPTNGDDTIETQTVEEGDQQPTNGDDTIETQTVEEGDQQPTNGDDTIETQTVEEGDQQPTNGDDTIETQTVEEGDQQVARSQQDGGSNQDLSPSLFDDVPDHIVDQIIADLRSDPSLKQIMDDVENQDVHEQIMDLDIDLPSPEDLLQQEIDNLFS